MWLFNLRYNKIREFCIPFVVIIVFILAFKEGKKWITFSFALNLCQLVFLRFLNLEIVQNTQRANFPEDYVLKKQGKPHF